MNNISSDIESLIDVVALCVSIMERDKLQTFPQEHLDHQNHLDINDETPNDENMERSEPSDFDYSSDESRGDDINYDPAMDAYSSTSDSDVESPYELERLSRCVARMERESQLDTLDRGPYPLVIQPPTSIAYTTTLVDETISSNAQPSLSTTEHSLSIIDQRPRKRRVRNRKA